MGTMHGLYILSLLLTFGVSRATNSSSECSKDLLMRCAPHLWLNTTDVPFSVQYVDMACRETVPITAACLALARPMCSDDYPIIPDTFIAMLDFVCTEHGKVGIFRHYDCLRWEYFAICDRQVETDDQEVVCRTVHSMIDCVQTRANLICGTDAGSWINDLLRHSLTSGHAGVLNCETSSGTTGVPIAGIVVGVIVVGGFLIVIAVIIGLRWGKHKRKYRRRVPQSDPQTQRIWWQRNRAR